MNKERAKLTTGNAKCRSSTKFRLHWQLGVLAALLVFSGIWVPVIEGENAGYSLIGALFFPVSLILIWGWVLSRVRRLNGIRLISDVLRRQPSQRKSRLKADISGSRRNDMKAIITVLDRYARRLNSGAVQGEQHPTAKLLKLAAVHLRAHLSQHASVLQTVPADVEDTLRRTAVVLSGTTNVRFLQETEELLEARIVPTDKTMRGPGRGHFVSAGIDLTERATGLFLRMLAAALVVWLLLSRQMSAMDLVQLLP